MIGIDPSLIFFLFCARLGSLMRMHECCGCGWDERGLHRAASFAKSIMTLIRRRLFRICAGTISSHQGTRKVPAVNGLSVGVHRCRRLQWQGVIGMLWFWRFLCVSATFSLIRGTQSPTVSASFFGAAVRHRPKHTTESDVAWWGVI